MATFRLEYYSFRIKKKRKEEYTNIESALGDITFAKFFKKFAGLFEAEIEVDDIDKKTFQFDSKNFKYSSKERFISGRIDAGEYGLARNVADIVTKKKKGKLNKTDSIISPFYFFLYFPKDSVIGYLCIQRLGLRGISNVFFGYFREFFRKHTEDYILEHSPLISKALLIKLIEDSTINQVTLRRYNLPTERTNQLKVGIIEPSKPITAEFTLKNSGGFSLKDKVIKYINDTDGQFFDFPALAEIGFDHNSETSITVDTGHSERTIVLNHLDRFKTSFDVDKRVKFDVDGYP